MKEAFTFVVLTSVGHSVETRIADRKEADAYFDLLCRMRVNEGVFYYAASVGGLVNAYNAV